MITQWINLHFRSKEAAPIHVSAFLIKQSYFQFHIKAKFYFIFCSADLLDLLTYTSFVSINTNIMPPMYLYTLALGEENPYYSKRCRDRATKRVYKYIYRLTYKYVYKLEIYPHFPLSSEILSKCFPLTYLQHTMHFE